MKYLFLFIAFIFYTRVQANIEVVCPKLAGTYMCKGDGELYEATYEQKTEQGYEYYYLPLLDGFVWLPADTQKHDVGGGFAIAECTKKGLEVYHTETAESDGNTLIYEADHSYSLKKNNELHWVFKQSITYNGKKDSNKRTVICKEKGM